MTSVEDKSNDIAFVIQWKQGSQEAYLQLRKKYLKKVYGICWRILNDVVGIDPELVTDEIFDKADKSIRGLQDEAKFISWLCKIAVNSSITILNKYRPELLIEDENPIELISSIGSKNKPDTTSQEDELLEKEKNEIILNALNALRTNHRIVITLRYYEGLSEQETAEIMGIGVGAVGPLLWNALHVHLAPRLREYFA